MPRRYSAAIPSVIWLAMHSRFIVVLKLIAADCFSAADPIPHYRTVSLLMGSTLSGDTTTCSRMPSSFP